MKRVLNKFSGIALFVISSAGALALLIFVQSPKNSYAEESSLMEMPSSSDYNSADPTGTGQKAMESKEATESMSGLEELKSKEPVEPKKTASKKGVNHAEGFIAPPDWEFDGFIAGGRDQNVKSLYTVNDLLYLTVGRGQGVATGDAMDVFRRGDKIKDPQTSRNLGFEVRKIAIIEITDRIDNATSSARVLKAYEPIELGDLVKRAE